MAKVQPQEQSLYGLPVPVTKAPTPPVLSRRTPVGTDTGYPLTQIWLNTTLGSAWMLVDVSGGVATWQPLLGGGAGVQTINAFLPIANNFNFTNLGGLSIAGAAGVFSAGVNVTGPVLQLVANSITAQRSSAAAGSNPLLNGVAHFDSSQFAVDANGFVSLAGGGIALDQIAVQAVTAPGVSPVDPDGTGLISINGASVVAAGVPVQSRSIALNSLQIEVQTSSAQAVSTPTANGLCHFDSTQFAVDAGGFVTSLTGTVGWLDAVAPQALANHTGYFATVPGAYTLPLGVANGDQVEIVDISGGGVIVTAAGADIIQISNVTSTPGGTATSTQSGDSLRLTFRAGDSTWYSTPGASGNWVLA